MFYYGMCTVPNVQKYIIIIIIINNNNNNLTYKLNKSISKEVYRRLQCFHYFFSKQKLLGASLQCNKRMCYHLSILMFINHHNQILFTQIIHLTVSLACV